jgi:hypothetical protein
VIDGGASSVWWVCFDMGLRWRRSGGGVGRLLGCAGRCWEVLGGFFVFGDLCPLGEMQKAVKWVEKRG